jgi:hypothetical protein
MDQFVEYLARTEPAALLPEDPHRLAKKYKLNDEDVCERTATIQIRNHDDLIKHMFAVHILRKYGKIKHHKLADRIDRLCRIHPEFGHEAKAVLAHHSLELGAL